MKKKIGIAAGLLVVLVAAYFVVTTVVLSSPKNYTCEEIARSSAKTDELRDELIPLLRTSKLEVVRTQAREVADVAIEDCRAMKPEDKPYEVIKRDIANQK